MGYTHPTDYRSEDPAPHPPRRPGSLAPPPPRPLPDVLRPLATLGGRRDATESTLLLLLRETPMEAPRFLALRCGLRGAIAQGMRLVVADPRRTHPASMAHDWLPIRPKRERRAGSGA